MFRLRKFLIQLTYFAVLASSPFELLYAQGTTNTPYIPNVIPPSPNASALMKFTDVPVSTYTGTADITVPIYTIQAKGITVPVSLSYHTGGIKLKEEASWVGLGWALNAGGMISRTILGHDDFGSDGVYYLTNQVPQPSGDLSSSQNRDYTGEHVISPYIFDFFCNYLVNFTSGQADFTPAFSAHGDVYDMEPDIFSYNFSGHSGKFMLTRTGNVVVQKQENIRIRFQGSGNTVVFTITDDQGNTFYFNVLEQTAIAPKPSQISSWLLSKIVTQQNDSVIFNYYSGGSTSSEAPDYSQTSANFCSAVNGLSTTYANNPLYLNKALQSIDFSNGHLQFAFDSSRTDLYNGYKLDSVMIYSRNAFGTLNYLKQDNFYYSYFNSVFTALDPGEHLRLRLDSVKEKTGSLSMPPYSFTYNNPNPGLGSAKHSFNVDHWGYYNGADNHFLIPTMNVTDQGGGESGFDQVLAFSGANRQPNFATMQDFSLQQVSYPTGGKTVLAYEANDYDYNNSIAGQPDGFIYVQLVTMDSLITLEHRTGTLSGTIDLTHIYPITAEANNVTINVTFRYLSDNNFVYHQSNQIYFTLGGSTWGIGSATCSPNGPVCTLSTPQHLSPGVYNWSANIDPSIDVATVFAGIYVEVLYQETQQVNNQVQNNSYILPAGGLRIQSITNYKDANNIASKKVYGYTYLQDKQDAGTPQQYTYGRLMSQPSYVRYAITTNSQGGECTAMYLFSSSLTSLTSLNQGNIVGYDQVTEFNVDPQTGQDIGKTVYTYYNSADTAVVYSSFRMPGTFNMCNNLNGLLLSKVSYANNGTQYVKVDESDFSYHTTNRITYWSPKYQYFGVGGAESDVTKCTPPTAVAAETLAWFYPSIKSEKILQDSTTEYLFDQFDTTKSFITKKYSYYDNPVHYQLTRSGSIDSKGNTLISQLKYPQDYIPNGLTQTNNTILDSLINRNMVAGVIEKKDSLIYAGTTTGKVTGAQLSKYKFLNGGSMGPDKQYRLDLAGPIGNFQQYSVNGNTTNQDSRYRQMISFDSYDSANNIAQYTPVDQTPVSLLWNYKKMYPVAQVKNAVLSDIAYTSFEADGSGNWSFPQDYVSSSQTSVNVNAAGSAIDLFTIQTPVTGTENDYPDATNIQGIELGVKFSSGSSGTVTGIRFYKTAGNTGTHVGELYSSTGVRLAQATFVNETSTGWQTVLFSSPVTITANTTYMAAYFSSLGYYVEDNNYFLNNPVSNGTLNAPSDGTNGGDGTDPGNGQGTFLYTSTAAFPNQLYKSSNYWVDVIFTNGTTPYAFAGNNKTITLPASSVDLDGGGSLGTITSYSWTKVSGPNNPTITSPTSTSTMVTGLIAGNYVFQLSVNGGASTSQVSVTVIAAGSNINIFTNQIPAAFTGNDYPEATNIQGFESGVKFSPRASGTVTGIRFYKTTGNSGAHIGELYSSIGVRLAQATFVNETATGWQTVLFSSPVSVTANATYTAAYFSSLGYYVEDDYYFSNNPVINGPLVAAADGSNGLDGTDPGNGQGTYLYTATATFPNQLYKSANYWVDVIFISGSTPVANTESSKSVTLLNSTTVLDGSGSTGTLNNYLWTKVSGPNNPTITSPQSLVTTVTGLIQGTYLFQLAVNGGDTSVFALTGTKSYNLAGNTISKSGLVSGKKYTLSYWTRGSACSVSGATSTVRTGRSVNGWTYYEHVVTMTSTTLSITGSGYLDELRLYPQGSQMVSLAYQPLVGETANNDPNSEITYYEYDSLTRLKNIRDYQGSIIKNYQYNYGQACTNCVLIMKTLAQTATLSYPVGVFSVANKLLGNATTQSQYISLWNADATNHAIGTLTVGSDSMHFILNVNSGQTPPGYIIGCRYYQYDLPYTQVDAVRNSNGVYVDYGDGTGMFLGKTLADSNVAIAPNTVMNVLHSSGASFIYWIHSYPDASTKTITFYHNDLSEYNQLDNAHSPATSLTLLRNLRGNVPQNTINLIADCNQQASALSVSSITNWNSINSITHWQAATGDNINPCLHMSYPQDFLANNRNLQYINTTGGFYREGYEDTTFKISRIKSDWNTYFTNLNYINISEDHWNHEDLSALTKLNLVQVIAGNQNHSYTQTNNPLVPITVSVIDNIINQVAAGAGQTVNNGIIDIWSAGTSRSSASNNGVNILKAKGWTIIVNSITQ